MENARILKRKLWLFAVIIIFVIYTFSLYTKHTKGKNADNKVKVQAHDSPSAKIVNTETKLSVSQKVEGRNTEPVRKVMLAVAPSWICNEGRLGNKMYMTASTYVAAMRLNATFVSAANGCEWPKIFAELFTAFSSSVKLLPTSELNKWTLVKEKAFTEFEPILSHNGHNIIVDGFRQTWKYFDKDHEITALRQLFTFTEKYELSSRQTLDRIHSLFPNIHQPIFVGVHIRKGDLTEPGPAKFGYQAADIRFYQSAMRRMTSVLNTSSSIIFVAGSDSLVEAKQLFSNLSKTYNIAWLSGSAYEDFAALSKCNHTIISGGTYGFWAAWMANGKTIYFSQFARAGSQFEQEYNKQNFFLPSWTPVAWN